MKNKKKIHWLSGIFAIILFICALQLLPHIAGILMLVSAVLLAPIEKLQQIIQRILPKKSLRTVLLVTLLMASLLTAPNAPLPSPDADISSPTLSEEETQTDSSNDLLPEETAEKTDASNTENAEPKDVTTAVPDSAASEIISPETKIPSSPQATETSAASSPEKENSVFEVHFIDVGQADAALILCDREAMLIDGGNAEDSNLIYTYLKNHGISHLRYVVATHAHEDHIGGLSGALHYATADIIYCPVTEYDSRAFRNFVKSADQQNVPITVPHAGETFSLGSADVEIFACNAASDPNNSSIVLKITYGETSFLFTGDAEREAEQVILRDGYDLHATVLKVGHHGSENSTTYPFLREIMPAYAVISVGKNNSYGHPTSAALSRLRDADVTVFRTDLQGDILCTSDGKTVSFTFQKGDGTSASQNAQQEETTPPATSARQEETEPIKAEGTAYIGNKNSRKFHYTWCSSAKKINKSNRFYYTGTREEMISKGYTPCKNCNP